MQRHRFFLPEIPINPNCSITLAPLAHQLHNVLRLGAGDVITLLDGSGDAFPTEIVSLDSRQGMGRVLARERVHTEPAIDLTLYQCALKGARFEWVLQKGTELGVRRFVPVISSRTVVRPARKLRRKYERWKAIMREAAEQSGRGLLPILADPLDWDEAIQNAVGVRLITWEEEHPGFSPPKQAERPGTQPASVALLIGPEGGISPREAATAFGRGWQPLSLGPRTLRAETAAIVALALILHQLGALGGRNLTIS